MSENNENLKYFEGTRKIVNIFNSQTNQEIFDSSFAIKYNKGKVVSQPDIVQQQQISKQENTNIETKYSKDNKEDELYTIKRDDQDRIKQIDYYRLNKETKNKELAYIEFFDYDNKAEAETTSVLYKPNTTEMNKEQDAIIKENEIGFRYYANGNENIGENNYFTVILDTNNNCEKSIVLEHEVKEFKNEQLNCTEILNNLFKNDFSNKNGNEISGTYLKTLAYCIIKKKELEQKQNNDIDLIFKDLVINRKNRNINIQKYIESIDNAKKFTIIPVNLRGHATVTLIDNKTKIPYLFDSSLAHIDKKEILFVNGKNLQSLNNEEIQVNGCCTYWSMSFINTIVNNENGKYNTIEQIQEASKNGQLQLDTAIEMGRIFGEDNQIIKYSNNEQDINKEDYIKIKLNNNNFYSINKNVLNNKFLKLEGIKEYCKNYISENQNKELNDIVQLQNFIINNNKFFKEQGLIDTKDIIQKIKDRKINLFEEQDDKNNQNYENKINKYFEEEKIKDKKIKFLQEKCKNIYSKICFGDEELGELTQEEWDIITNRFNKDNYIYNDDFEVSKQFKKNESKVKEVAKQWCEYISIENEINTLTEKYNNGKIITGDISNIEILERTNEIINEFKRNSQEKINKRQNFDYSYFNSIGNIISVQKEIISKYDIPKYKKENNLEDENSIDASENTKPQTHQSPDKKIRNKIVEQFKCFNIEYIKTKLKDKNIKQQQLNSTSNKIKNTIGL